MTPEGMLCIPVKFEPSPTKLVAVTTPAVTLNPDASSVAAVQTFNFPVTTTPVELVLSF